MAFVCYPFLKEANIHVNLICSYRNFDHPHIDQCNHLCRCKQSKKSQFFHKNIVFVEKVFDIYLLLGLSSRFSQNSHIFFKNCCSIAVPLKID